MSIPDRYRQFARDLVTSKELDPMYDFMANARIAYGNDWADRYSLYLFMFYDARGAIAAADALDFWAYVRRVYDTAKRGSERRHFRGAKGWDAITTMSYSSPTEIWNAMYRPNYKDLYYNIVNNFEGCQIGDYFRWKTMDIFDRTMSKPVSLSMYEACLLLPESPRKCAKDSFPDHTLKGVLEGIKAVIESE